MRREVWTPVSPLLRSAVRVAGNAVDMQEMCGTAETLVIMSLLSILAGVASNVHSFDALQR